MSLEHTGRIWEPVQLVERFALLPHLTSFFFLISLLTKIKHIDVF